MIKLLNIYFYWLRYKVQKVFKAKLKTNEGVMESYIFLCRNAAMCAEILETARNVRQRRLSSRKKSLENYFIYISAAVLEYDLYIKFADFIDEKGLQISNFKK